MLVNVSVGLSLPHQTIFGQTLVWMFTWFITNLGWGIPPSSLLICLSFVLATRMTQCLGVPDKTARGHHLRDLHRKSACLLCGRAAGLSWMGGNRVSWLQRDEGSEFPEGRRGWERHRGTAGERRRSAGDSGVLRSCVSRTLNLEWLLAMAPISMLHLDLELHLASFDSSDSNAGSDDFLSSPTSFGSKFALREDLQPTQEKWITFNL